MRLKPRSRGATAQTAEQKPIIGNAPNEVPKVPQDLVLQYQLAYVKRTLYCATDRKARLEDLMSRDKAKTWDAKKKAKMVRRLVAANQAVEQCVTAVDELTKNLEGVMAKMGAAHAHNVVPFVKAPPTSVEELAQQPAPEPAGLETSFGS
jgi:hypothetical protein